MQKWSTRPRILSKQKGPKGPKGNARLSQLILAFPRNSRRWAGPTSIAYTARSIGGHSKATTCATVIGLIKMALQPRVMGVQVGPGRKGCAKAQTFCRLFAWS